MTAAQRQAIIDRIVRGIQEALVPDELLPTTLAQLQTALGASRCLIFQTDTDRQITACYVSSATNDRSETLSNLAQTLQTRFDQSLSQGQEVVLSGTLIVPLMYQQEYLGSTILEADRALDPQAVEFVKRVAAHCAIAIAIPGREAKWRNRVENNRDLLWEMDENYIYTYVSPQVQSILGYSPAEILGKRASDLMPSSEAPIWDENKLPFNCVENKNIHKDGKIIVMESSGVPLFDQQGNFRGYRGIARDITKRAIARDMTKRSSTESALREREERFRHIFADSPMGIALCDREGNLLEVNQAFCQLLGYTESELYKMKFAQFTHPEDIEAEIILFGQCLEGKISSYQIEKRYIDKHGKNIWVNLSVGVILDREGKMRYGLGMVLDITERKQAEERLRLTERAIAASSNGIVIGDARLPEQPIIYVNPAFERITGYSAAEAIGQNFWSWQGEETNKWSAANNATVLLENYRKDGTKFWNELSISPIYDGEGNLTHYISIQNDITERQIAAVKLRATTSRLTALIENLQVGILAKDEQRQVVLTNQTFCDILDVPVAPKALIGADLSSFATEYQELFASPAEFVQRHQEIIEAKKVVMAEEIQMADGRVLERDYVPLFAEEKSSGHLWMYREITQRKQAEERLRLTDRAMAASHNGIIICDARPSDRTTGPDWPVVYVNRAFERITGYSAATVMGKNCRFLQGGDRSQPALEILRAAISQQQDCTVELRNYRRDGTLFWNELSVSPIYDSQGNLTHYIGIQTDITDRKQAEKELLMSQARQQYLLSSSPGVLYSRKPTGEHDIIFISDNVAAICGYRAGDFTQDASFWASHIHREDAQRATDLTALFEQGRYDCEYRFQHADGTYRWMYDQMRLVRDDPLEIVGYWTDISDRKQTEESLQQALDQLHAVLDAVPGFVSWMSSDLRYIGVNQHLAAAFNLSPEDFAGKELGFLENSPGFAQFMRQFLASPEKAAKQVIDAGVKEATRHYLIAAQKYQQGKAAVSVGIDITYRVQAEEQLKSSLKEKEVLLKEIHHRVKNNLQVISSLLKLQSGYVKDEDTLALFQDSYNRVRSMALIHENLYRSSDLGVIDVADYIRNLTANLLGSYTRSDRHIDLKLDLEHHWLDVDTAIPCGLIINELVSNSFKYAFEMITEGQIYVKFTRERDQFLLVVRDNGIGLPADFDMTTIESLGLQLVQNLTAQLGGDISLDSCKGTCFTITFTSIIGYGGENNEQTKSARGRR